jgi:hypothetical protein
MSNADPIRPSVDPELAATPIIDSGHPAVIEFATSRAAGAGSQDEQAIRTPTTRLSRSTPCEPARPSSAVAAGASRSPCCWRRRVAPWGSPRGSASREQMQTEVFYWHGYTSIRLGAEARWVKATPAFNIELCEKFGFLPLEFDGKTDSLYHPFDTEGRKHMEYVSERGEFDDVPLDEMLATFAEKYPSMNLGRGGAGGGAGSEADFDRDVEAEVTGGR